MSRIKINKDLYVCETVKEVRLRGFGGVLVQTPASTIYVPQKDIPSLIEALQKKHNLLTNKKD